MRSRVGLIVGLGVLAALGVGACGKPKSFVVLDFTSAVQISNVREVDVTVTQGTTLVARLKYPVHGDPLVINSVNTNNLSVSFTGGRSGIVALDIQVTDGASCVLGTASTSATIRQGDIVAVEVPLTPSASCTPPDGGAADGPEAVTFPGCDPVRPMCQVTTDTCQVDCMNSMAECVPGGTRGPGEPCDTNMDCAPGSQCFNYAGTGCGVKICLRFCDGDDVCQAHGAGGAADGGAADGGAADGGDAGGAEVGVNAPIGTRSVCQGLVPCGSVLTTYHTCTFACDPRQVAAAANQTGCPMGLSCLVVGNMDQVDCACAEGTRTGTDGVDCTGGADCAPGYICNMMGDTKKCRAICRCNNKDGACTAVNECGGSKSCAALTNETTFGVCL